MPSVHDGEILATFIFLPVSYVSPAANRRRGWWSLAWGTQHHSLTFSCLYLVAGPTSLTEGKRSVLPVWETRHTEALTGSLSLSRRANRVFRSVNCVHCHLSFVRVCLMSINEDLFSRFPALNSLLIYWCCDLELVASLRARCIFTYCRLCGVFMLFYLDTFFMSSGKVLDLIFNTIWEAFSINRESKFNN